VNIAEKSFDLDQLLNEMSLALDFFRKVDKNGRMKTNFIQPVVVAIGVVIVTGCSTQEKPNVKYIDPGSPGSKAGTGVESQDIGAAAQKAAQSIVNLPQIAQANTPPTVLITPVVNRSASPIDTELYTVKLRGILMQYATNKVRFLDRDVGWNVSNNEMALRQRGEVQQGQARNAATYDYILTAELRGISASSGKGRSEYFLVAFKLVDLNDVLLWENQYEIKKQGNDSTIYR
jgi:PBP1b-binding outer membrane lipoprotein LpoB